MAETNSSSPTTGAAGGGLAGGGTAGVDSPERGRSHTGGFIGRVRERASAQLTTQKDKATEGIGSVAEAVRQTTHQLREQHHETAAGYVEQVADQLERLSQGLRNKDIGDLVGDAQRLARRQPALFVGSAFAVGLLSARFLKSSSDEDDDLRGYGGTRGRAYSGAGRALPASGSEWRRSSPGTGGYTSASGTGAFGSSSRTESGVQDLGEATHERQTSGFTPTDERSSGSPRGTSRSRRGGPDTGGL